MASTNTSYCCFLFSFLIGRRVQVVTPSEFGETWSQVWVGEEGGLGCSVLGASVSPSEFLLAKERVLGRLVLSHCGGRTGRTESGLSGVSFAQNRGNGLTFARFYLR